MIRLTNRRKAITMVLTLWIVTVLTIIAASLAFDVQVNSKLALLSREQFQAYNLAKSAIAVGMTHLQNDLMIDWQENPQQPYDALSDVWAQPERKEKEIEVELGKGTFQLEISDEDSKININMATKNVLKALLEYYGYEAPDSDDVAAAIIDFRDQDDIVPAESGVKENEYYSGLVGQDIDRNTLAEELVYQCANEQFLTIDQLRDVYGITPELFHGYDPESDEERERLVRDNIALGKGTRKSRTNKNEEEALALKDVITVRGNGRINLNTASQEVLTILIHAATNFQDLDGAEAAAESIVDFRGGNRRNKAPDPEDAFKSIQDLNKVTGINPQVFSALSNANNFGVTISFKSDVFCITGIGRSGRVQKTITAIVSRQLEVYNPDDARLESNKNSGGIGSSSSRSRSSRSSTRSYGSSRRGLRDDNERDQDNYIRIPAVRVVQWIE